MAMWDQGNFGRFAHICHQDQCDDNNSMDVQTLNGIGNFVHVASAPASAAVVVVGRSKRLPDGPPLRAATPNG